MSSNSDLTPFGSIVVGSISSACAVSICQPGYAIKNHIMTGKGIPRPSLALYRGLTVNLACDQTNQPLAFAINNYYYNNFLQGKQTTLAEKIIGGAISATIVSPFLAFCERIMIIQQVQSDPVTKKGYSALQVIQKIKDIEGLRGFTKGVLPTIGRETVNATCFFGLQKILAKQLNDVLEKKELASVENKEVASAVAFVACGTISGAFTAPFDLIKTLTQSELDGTKGNYFKKLKVSIHRELGPNVAASLAKSCLARMILMSGLLGTLGTASIIVPKFLPRPFFKDSEN